MATGRACIAATTGLALLSAATAACGKPVGEPQMLQVTVPESVRGRTGPYPLTNMLQARARAEVEQAGEIAVHGIDYLRMPDGKEFMVAIALNRKTAIFYVTPMGPEAYAVGSDVAVCRLEVDLDSLRPGFSAQWLGVFYSTLAPPECKLSSNPELDQNVARERDADPSGYRIFAASDTLADGRRAAVIEPVSRRERPSAVASLRALLGPADPIRVVLPFPPNRGIAGYAASESGRVLFYRTETSEEDAVCIAEGLDWNAGVAWLSRRGAEDLENYCAAALRARDDEEAAAARAEWEKNPVPIRTADPRPIQTGNRQATPSASR